MQSDLEDERVLLDHLQQARRTRRVLAAIMACLIALPWIGWAAGMPLVGAIACTGGLVAMACGLWLWSLADPRKHPALHVLREHPDRVVWAYVDTVRQYGKAIASSVVLGLVDRRKLSLSAQVGREQELMALLARRVPHATLGFDPDREAAFRRDPSQLRRAA